MHEQKNVYSLRKLSVGLASVVVGTCFFISNGQNVKADTVNDGEQSTSTVIQQDSSKKQDQDSNEQNDQANVSNSKIEQQQSTNERNDVENVDSNLNDTDKLGNADDSIKKSTDKTVVKPVESEANQKFDQVKDQFKQETAKTKNVTSSVIEENDEGKTIQKAEATKKAATVMLRADSSETTLNLNGTNAIDPETLKEDKTETTVKANPARGIDPVKFASNGGFDPKIWGTMDTSKWQLDSSGNITGYTGDMSHIIIPNASDFAKVGKNYSQIGISAYEMKKLGGDNNSKADTLAISLTDNKKVKASDTYWSYTFYGSTLKQANLEGLDTSKVTNIGDMFKDASSLMNLDVSNWDTSEVTDMNWMFYGANSLKSLDVSNWDTSKVTNMSWMFYGASSLKSLDVSNWDTGNVTNMGLMFSGASGLTNLDVSKWDTSNVTAMYSMFSGASGLTNLDVSKWNTGNVTDMNWMFYNAGGLTSLDVSKWKTSKVTDMSWMFDGARSLKSLDVSKWKTSNVTNMNHMFNGASSLTSLDVSNWDTSKVTDMSGMFAGASRLTSLDVSNWDTSNVTSMGNMFNGASGLTSLNVSHWDTDNITDMSYMFNNAISLTSLDVSNWDTSKVTDMSWMFNRDPNLALIVNGDNDKFADYLVKNNFMGSGIDSNVKSVTTDNTKLLQLLTNDSQHDSATRTIVFTFPANYSPDLTKYHLTKVGSTYQIKQSADYDKTYLQGTVLINATGSMAYHHIDTTKPYKLSDTWQPNYDKLVLAHKNSDGSVSFDAIQLPQIPGYKAHLVRNPLNPAMFMVSFMAVPTENKPSTPVEVAPSKPSANADNTNKPADDLQHRVVTELNSNDSSWTMPNTQPATYTVEVPDDNTIDLSDLVIAEPVHAQTTTQIHVTKRFKLSKKYSIKHLKHRKKAVRTFRKYRL